MEKLFSDLDVLEEKKGEKIAYSHQLHTGYKSGSKLVTILRLKFFPVPEYSSESEKI